ASNNEILRFDWASQTYQLFVAPNSGGLLDPYGATFGSDGNLYVSTGSQSSVLEYDGTTGGFLGTYVTAGAGGLNWAGGLKFASDGNMYVCSWHSNQILKYQGLSIGPNGEQPGQFLGVFANTAHTLPLTYDIGPDSNFYVSCPQLDANGVANQAVIDRYYGPSSPFAGQFIGTFVATGSGGLSQSRTPLFDQQGHLFVADMTLNEVLRYQGPTESNPGAFIDTYVSTGQGGLSAPNGLATGSDGNLYVSSRDANKVTRFAPASQASFAVTLNSSTSNTVTVNYATANGTAVAGTDYTQTNGTLVFAPGVTSQTINVPITTVGTGGPTKTFTMNLSGASGATVSRAQGTGSILNRQTKFFVVDSGTVKTYEYGSGGTSEEITAETSTNTASRGVATTAAGTTVWVVDANKTVYVYDNHGVQLGSWSAGGLSGSAQLTGITTNGTDIWLVDSSADKVYKYAGAASRLLGSQNAVSSFNLVNGHNGNSNPQDIVTDGTSFWVVDGTAHKVFKYSLSGSSLGNWTIDAANAHPTGITINPSNVSDIWIVDNVTLKVYQYTGAAGRTSGSQNASATFALNPYDTNPQGIADPSPADMLLAPINAVSYPTPQFTQLGSPIVLDAHSTAAETSGSWRSLRDDDLVAALQLEPEVRNDVATAAASVPSTGARKTPTLDRLFVDLEDWFTV
ncbi:MAG TPA: Calx-beta domain-containing protein, partial [Gemmataceae bacterium]|nr:Calx-beta domain-containing protein [Gemmataceae bacterium]